MDLPFHHDATPSIFENARHLKKVMTPAEIALWKMLRSRKFRQYKFRRQHPIGSYIVDFYCHQSKLVIEADGPIHESEDNLIYDANRTETLESLGLRVIRFKNQEIIENLNSVLKEISQHLNPG